MALKYQEYKNLDLTEIDKNIQKFWDDNDVFAKSVNQRPEDQRFVFYEGPPSANGSPGIHTRYDNSTIATNLHVITRLIFHSASNSPGPHYISGIIYRLRI